MVGATKSPEEVYAMLMGDVLNELNNFGELLESLEKEFNED